MAERVPEYSAALTKEDKSLIVHHLIKEFNAKGRFICLNPATGCYFPAPVDEAREKVSQALYDHMKGQYKSSKDVCKRRCKIVQEAKKAVISRTSSPIAFPSMVELVTPSTSKQMLITKIKYIPLAPFQQQQQQQQQQNFSSACLSCGVPEPSSNSCVIQEMSQQQLQPSSMALMNSFVKSDCKPAPVVSSYT
jgi:hypothetical protein